MPVIYILLAFFYITNILISIHMNKDKKMQIARTMARQIL